MRWVGSAQLTGLVCFAKIDFWLRSLSYEGVAQWSCENPGLSKFLAGLKISESFVLSLGISFLHACIFCVSVSDFCAHRLGLGFSN